MHRKIFFTVLSIAIIVGLISAVAFTGEKSMELSGDFSVKVDVGGYSLYINVEGQRQNGLPTVVFENGLACSCGYWDEVAWEIAKVTRVVTYDRINISQSDPVLDRSKVDFTVEGTARRLHTLLKRTGVNGPVVLVGHSHGGVLSRGYQYLYPDQVKGIVFIDSSTEHIEEYLFPESDIEKILYNTYTGGTGIPDEMSVNDGLISDKQIDAAQTTDPLRNLPIVVLSGGNHMDPDPKFEARWADRQAYIAGLSDRSVHKIDANNGHTLQLENPPFVIDAIKELLNQLKVS